MVNIEDYIYISKNTKRYKLHCDSCKIDRGYGMKSRSTLLCKKCTHVGKCYFNHNNPSFKEKMSKAKKGQIPHNKNKSKYTVTQKTLRCNMSAAIRIRLNNHGSSKKGKSYLLSIGYTIEQLKVHLESKFYPNPRTGIMMTWNNWGKWSEYDNTWHIDHVIPDSVFQYASMEDKGFKDSWALNNLQPMWAKDNLIKSNKVV